MIGAPLSASTLFALAHSRKQYGHFECHWCASPCSNFWTHDEPPPIMGVKQITIAKRPGSHWICTGCWLYRRPSVTIYYLSGSYKDRQNYLTTSWLVTPERALGIRPLDYDNLYDILLKPPTTFSLSMIREGMVNHIQLAVVNYHDQVEAGTELFFTINGILHSYTVYELTEALKSGETGKQGGVRALLNLLGERKTTTTPPPVLGRGRPSKPRDDGRVTKKVISQVA